MSEQEKQAAIAKIQAQGCRKWLSLLIIAPVFLCAALAILGPTLNNMLARQESGAYCDEQLTSGRGIEANPQPIAQSDDFVSGNTITADNIDALTLLGATVVSIEASQRRDDWPMVEHPQRDYIVYRDANPSEATRFFFCQRDTTAVGAVTLDETAGDMVFNRDGTLLAIAEGRLGRVRIFDAVAIMPMESINILGAAQSRQIESVAFHPTQDLLFFTSEGELFVYETETFSEVYRLDIGETMQREISFNDRGTLLFIAQSTTDVPHAEVWGIVAE